MSQATQVVSRDNRQKITKESIDGPSEIDHYDELRHRLGFAKIPVTLAKVPRSTQVDCELQVPTMPCRQSQRRLGDSVSAGIQRVRGKDMLQRVVACMSARKAYSTSRKSTEMQVALRACGRLFGSLELGFKEKKLLVSAAARAALANEKRT